MIAKRSFGFPLFWTGVSDQSEFSLGDQTVRAADRILRHSQFPATQQRCENQLRYVFRQRRDRGNDQCRRPTKKDCHRQRLFHLLSRVIMKAATFLNLPMQSGSARVISLHAINAEVVLPRDRVLGINQWQRDERSTVLMPRSQHREFIKSRRSLDDLS